MTEQIQKVKIDWSDRINFGVWNHAWRFENGAFGDTYGLAVQLCDGLFWLFTPFVLAQDAADYVPEDSCAVDGGGGEPDVCALGIYSLKISGVINDTSNYGATAIVITSGNDSVQIDVPNGAGWRDTLLNAFAVEIGQKTLRFSADNSNAEQPMIDITNTSLTPNVSDTFSIELVGGGAHDIAAPAEFPVIDVPDQQHVTFKLCRTTGVRPLYGVAAIEQAPENGYQVFIDDPNAEFSPGPFQAAFFARAAFKKITDPLAVFEIILPQLNGDNPNIFHQAGMSSISQNLSSFILIHILPASGTGEGYWEARVNAPNATQQTISLITNDGLDRAGAGDLVKFSLSKDSSSVVFDRLGMSASTTSSNPNPVGNLTAVNIGDVDFNYPQVNPYPLKVKLTYFGEAANAPTP